ncbi:hypothetical protein TNCV_3992051 [Trichonephila clavipes]|uniref:Uncharacterized protein n=1 Tax=Trichonephila clavipes TaxID=2585209 RepID=A0A8X6SXJ8_TRICX|nr:hypothetical protein TNCV_3992051 [Trichonephila clavipes]
MTSCNHLCCHLRNGSQEPFFNKTMLRLTRQGCHKTVSALLVTFNDLPESPDLSPIELICDHLGRGCTPIVSHGGELPVMPSSHSSPEIVRQQILHRGNTGS